MNSGNKGLANLGNTCYMNSAIQCLSHLLEFHPKHEDFITEQRGSSDIYSEWIALQIKLWSNDSTGPVVPTSFLQTFMRECQSKDIPFYNFRQNDTEEFINLFMDFLHQSIKKRIEIEIQGPVVSQYDKLAYKAMNSWSQFFKNDYSYIVKKFYSQLFSITSCTKCDYNTVNFDPTMVVSLEIPLDATCLYDCLDSFTQKTILDCDNSWKCDKCKQRVEPEKKLLLWKTSDVLILLLKRYSKGRKNDTYIEFPTILDLSRYSLNYGKGGTSYRLSGISIQSGSLGGGHYYAMCYNELDKTWRTYNDTTVNEITEEIVSKQKPYCLFYRRI